MANLIYIAPLTTTHGCPKCFTAKEEKSNQIKSLLLSHHHSTCVSVSEIYESVLQTEQKQFTYRQYILTDLYRRQCAENTHTYTQYTQCTIRHTCSYQYTLHTKLTHFTLCTPIHTMVCKKKYIIIIKNTNKSCSRFT